MKVHVIIGFGCGWYRSFIHSFITFSTYEMILFSILHIWQPLSMCRQNSVRGQPENPTEAFSTICAVYIEDCEGWWSSGCCGSVAEPWRLKPEVSCVRLLATAGFFTFLYFRHITSKFIYFQREARCFQHYTLS